jgi:hypothetical protein
MNCNHNCNHSRSTRLPDHTKAQVKHGATCRNRTDDLLITSGLEYVPRQFTADRTMTFAQVSAGGDVSTGRYVSRRAGTLGQFAGNSSSASPNNVEYGP